MASRFIRLLCTAVIYAMSLFHVAAYASGPAEATLFNDLNEAFKDPDEIKGLPNVLILGDSISIGYTSPLRRRLANKANVYRASENCRDTGYAMANLDRWLGSRHWDVIHFNWGIWDTHLLDEKGQIIADEANYHGFSSIRFTPEQYAENLNKIVDRLQKTGAKLVWASTTPGMSRTGKRFEDIEALNAVAAEIMKKRGIPTDDLFSFVLPQAEKLQQADQFHFTDSGSNLLAGRVGESILDQIAATKD